MPVVEVLRNKASKEGSEYDIAQEEGKGELVCCRVTQFPNTHNVIEIFI